MDKGGVRALFYHYIAVWRKTFNEELRALLFFLPRLVPESVRWLTTHKRTGEAEKLLKRVAKTNRKTMPEESLGLPEDQKVTEREAGFMDLFGSRSMTKKTVISWISW